MHATDPLIYCREPKRNVFLNLSGKCRQAKLYCRGDSGLRSERRNGGRRLGQLFHGNRFRQKPINRQRRETRSR
jgi:hypothetical protein